MNATIVFGCLLAMSLIVVASIAAIFLSAKRRPRDVADGAMPCDATLIAAVVAASTAASVSCSDSASTSCS